MSSTVDRLRDEARRILNSVWNLSPGYHSLVAHRWFKSREGLDAFCEFALRMNSARSDAERDLIAEIFALRVEIASRHAGWRLELDAPLTLTELTTDCLTNGTTQWVGVPVARLMGPFTFAR